MMEALDVIRDRADNVRLVRVMSGDDPPPGAKKQGDFYYLVDLMPRSEPRRNDRGRGGPGRHDAAVAVAVAAEGLPVAGQAEPMGPAATSRVASNSDRAAIEIAISPAGARWQVPAGW